MTAKNFDLYGMVWDIDRLAAARIAVEKALSLSLVERDSSYRCGVYFLYEAHGRSVSLQKNFDPREKEWTEEEFMSYPLLLYVNGFDDMESVREKLLWDVPGCVHLRRREIEES